MSYRSVPGARAYSRRLVHPTKAEQAINDRLAAAPRASVENPGPNRAGAATTFALAAAGAAV